MKLGQGIRQNVASKDRFEAISQERRNTIFRESFDWAQGDDAQTHAYVVAYVCAKHPEWKRAFNNKREMATDKHLRATLKSRTEGSRHASIEPSQIPEQHKMFAEQFASNVKNSDQNDEYEWDHILGKLCSLIVSRDIKYSKGRPEKSTPRSLTGHGRKFQSFFCDYVLLKKEYPGDKVWNEMTADLRKHLLTGSELSIETIGQIETLIAEHNKWCDQGKADTKIDVKALGYPQLDV